MSNSWQEGDLRINGATIHYARTGDGTKPPLVLVHGFSDSGGCWLPVARALEGDFDVVMPDMRGHGESERLVEGEAVDMSLDIASLIETLGLRKPVLCGHSMGALMSFQTAVRFPELLRALVLEDPPWFLRTPDAPIFSPDFSENPMAQWAASLESQSYEELLAGYRSDHPDWPGELCCAMARSKKQLDPRAFRVLFPRMGGDRWPWWETVHHLRLPTLLMAGNPALGGIVNEPILETLRSLNGGVRVEVFANAGHLIRYDQSEGYMRALRGFLNQL